MSDPADLINLAIETLTKANVELPAFSALDRVVGHLRQEVHATLYQSITADLTRKQFAALDALLEVPPGENVSPFARFKESPGPVTLHHIRQWTERLAELDAIIDLNRSLRASRTPRSANSPPRELKAFREEVHARMPERHLLDVLKHGPGHSGFIHSVRWRSGRRRG